MEAVLGAEPSTNEEPRSPPSSRPHPSQPPLEGPRAYGELHWIPWTVQSENERASAIYDYNLESAAAAAWDGNEPLIWLCFGLGFLLKFYAFIDQLVQPCQIHRSPRSHALSTL